MEATKIFDTIR